MREAGWLTKDQIVEATFTPPSSTLIVLSQCLSLLRVLVCNPESHQILVEAKVIPAIVKQVGERAFTSVWVIEQRCGCPPRFTPPFAHAPSIHVA